MVPVQSLPRIHPWAFKQNDPQKRIAALELYGTLFLALLLMAQVDFISCWWVTIRAMSTPFSTMLLGRCRRLLSSWSLSTNFTKLVTCWLLPTHVEMTINGLMSWRILTLKALIRLWEWISRPIFINLLWFQKIWKLAILPCGKTTWIPTCDLLGKGGSWI